MIDPPAVRDALKRHRKLKGVGSPAGTTLISPTMLSSTSGLVPLSPTTTTPRRSCRIRSCQRHELLNRSVHLLVLALNCGNRGQSKQVKDSLRCSSSGDGVWLPSQILSTFRLCPLGQVLVK